MALAIRCRRPVGSSASAAPRIAKLSLSVPPLVKTTSEGSAPNQGGHLRARLVQCGLGPLTEMVDARRVAELVAQGRHHPFDDGRRNRRGGVVIEINALHLCRG